MRAEPRTVAVPAMLCPGRVVQSPLEVEQLASCTHIKGDLIIRAASARDLSPLARLAFVSGVLKISGNAELTDLDGLSSLRSVRSLVLRDNARLGDVRALSNLSRADSIVIEGNPKLAALHGLGHVTSLRRLVVRRTSLRSLSGLEGLREAKSISILYNSRLISAGALNGVTRAEAIEVRGNPLLFGGREDFFAGLERSRSLVISGNSSIFAREADRLERRVLTEPAAPLAEARLDSSARAPGR